MKIGTDLVGWRVAIIYWLDVQYRQGVFMSHSVHPVGFERSHTPFEQLARRIHRQVNSSAAQTRRRTVIAMLASEKLDDWDCLLEQLDVEDSVRVTRLECGAVDLAWTNQHASTIAFA